MSESPGEVTILLRKAGAGDASAQRELLEVVYNDLRKLAAWHMKNERPGHTLQPTALVHEVYLKLVRDPSAEFRDRAHFFRIAARCMRQVLVDHARHVGAGKRGDAKVTVRWDESLVFDENRSEEALAVDSALERLAEFDGRLSQVVDMR